MRGRELKFQDSKFTRAMRDSFSPVCISPSEENDKRSNQTTLSHVFISSRQLLQKPLH